MDQTAPDMSMRSLQERAARFGGTNTVRNVFIVAIAYYLGAEIAFLIGTLSDRIFAPFWPPNIVLFCALLVTPPRQWWIYIAAALPAHTIAELGVGMPMPQLIVAFVTNCLVAIANAFAVQHLMVEPPWFGTIRKTIIYVLITAFLSPAFCALGGAFVQILGGGSIEDYGLFWARWYASNALGSLTLGPIAMICIESTTRPRFAPTGRAVEAVIIAAFLGRGLHRCVRRPAIHCNRLPAAAVISSPADSHLGGGALRRQGRQRRDIRDQRRADMAHAQRPEPVRHRLAGNKRLRHAAFSDRPVAADPAARFRYRGNAPGRTDHAGERGANFIRGSVFERGTLAVRIRNRRLLGDGLLPDTVRPVSERAPDF